MASPPAPPPPPSSSSSSSPSSPSSLASLPAPVWGPALSIAALILANILALLLNPGLFRACCYRCRRRPAADTKSDPEAQQRRAGRPPSPSPSPSPPPSPSAAAPPPPRRCRCWPLPFFASNVDREGRRKSPRPLPPLPSELWGFDVLSPLDPLSSWLSPRSVRERVASVGAAGDAREAWRPATWVLLPLHVFTFLYFVAYVLAETLWSIPLPGSPDHPYPQWLTYLTNWSITLLGMAGLFGVANTLRASCGRRGGGGGGGSAGQAAAAPRWDPLSIAHLLVSEVAASAALFVSIFYWAGVVGLGGGGGGGSSFDACDPATYLAHAGNAAVALLLLALSRLPVASPHFLALLWYASAYEVFAWAYGGATADWRYGLDWQRAGPAFAYALTPALCFFVFFVLVFGSASLREAVGRRRWCWCGCVRG